MPKMKRFVHVSTDEVYGENKEGDEEVWLPHTSPCSSLLLLSPILRTPSFAHRLYFLSLGSRCDLLGFMAACS